MKSKLFLIISFILIALSYASKAQASKFEDPIVDDKVIFEEKVEIVAQIYCKCY